MNYRLTPQAQRDVRNIGDRIAFDNSPAARALVEAFRKRWRLLASHPFSGRSRADLLPDLRQVVVGNYLSFYRVEDDEILVLRVIHSSRDLTSKSLLAPQRPTPSPAASSAF